MYFPAIVMVITTAAFVLASYILGKLNARYVTKLMKEQNQRTTIWLNSLAIESKAQDDTPGKHDQTSI